MYDKDIHWFCSEFYTVEKTIEVIVRINDKPTLIRIEAVKDEINGRYSITAYVQEEVTLEPKKGGKFVQKPQEYSIWVNYELPWVDCSTAD
jgi:hypothetical protein